MEISKEIMNYAGEDRNFAQWLAEVDVLVQKRLGLDLFQLGDFLLRDTYDKGGSPSDCCRSVLTKFEEGIIT